MSEHLITRLASRLRTVGEFLIVAAVAFIALASRLDELGISYNIGLMG